MTSRALSTLFIVLSLSVGAGTATAWKTECHPTITDFAVQVLDDDNYTYLADYLSESGALEKVKKAVKDCDRIDLAVNHYYNPITEEGFAGATPATVIAESFFEKAVDTYIEGDVESSWYYFGWSLHVVQDLFVPFHAHLDALNGHTQFEQYVYDQRFFYPLPSNGTYDAASNASEWVNVAATTSYSYYDGISGDNATEENFDLAALVLLPAAVALTAGYFKFYSDTIGLGDFSIYSLARGVNYIRVGWDEALDPDFQAYEVYVSEDEDEIFSEDPYAVIYDRETTEKTIVKLELGTDYYVKVRALATGATHQSNLLKVTPQWPLVFILIPAVTSLAVVVILISKKHRQPRRTRR